MNGSAAALSAKKMIASAIIVHLYPALLSSAVTRKGYIVPPSPVPAYMIPEAMPTRLCHHSKMIVAQG
jgi:hypothetical protein